MQERPKHWDEFYRDFRHYGNLRVSVDGVQYSAADIVSCKVERYLSDSGPGAGNACAACLTLRIIPRKPVPRAACVRLYYQLRLSAAVTDFIRKGTFYVSKRRQDGRILVLECYDAMLKAEQEFLTEETTDDWPKSAAEVVTEIAARMGLSVDSRNMDLSPACYNVGLPAGLTMREVLQDIAARAGGNWCVSTLDTLRLVPVRGTGDVAPGVTGRPSVHPPMTIAGVRLWADSESYWPSPAPLPDGDILDAMATDATPDGAATLYGNVAGTVYRPYESEGRHIDPACELGDTVPIGGVEYLAWRMVEHFHQSYSVDLSAPAEDSEVEDEYPFLTQAERLNKRVSRLATTISSISKKQNEIVLRVETVELESQSLADASAEHSQELATLSLSLDGFKTEVYKSYSTTEEMRSAINQSASSIQLEVSKTYATQSSLGSYTKTSEVRSRFAMDSSSVTISSGRIAFTSNTITISSTNFTLDSSGNVSAKGSFTSDGTRNEYVQILNGILLGGTYSDGQHGNIDFAGHYAGANMVAFSGGVWAFLTDTVVTVNSGYMSGATLQGYTGDLEIGGHSLRFCNGLMCGWNS